MIEINIPGFKDLKLSSLVLDFNGTLACDGMVLSDVRSNLNQLAKDIEIHVVTADTFGKVGEALSGLPCRISVLSKEAQAQAKLDYVKQLGVERTCSIGNGRNDGLMLKESSLGICVVQAEGASSEAIHAADVFCRDIVDALELLRNPLRLTATLRS